MLVEASDVPDAAAGARFVVVLPDAAAGIAAVDTGGRMAEVDPVELVTGSL
jgi:hypothetical protein